MYAALRRQLVFYTTATDGNALIVGAKSIERGACQLLEMPAGDAHQQQHADFRPHEA